MRASPILAVAAALAVAGCARGPDRPDVILVTIDTLRADRLGCYGDTAGSTPVLDAIARDGVRFERASAAAPVTLPSHATILTGRYPAAHGVRNNGTFTLAPSETTLAEVMRPEGYRTGAFVGSWILSKPFGLGQGFELFDDRFDGPGAVQPAPGPAARGARPTERRAEAVTDAALAWARAQPRREPLFLWVHYYDPHVSYQPPSPWLERFPDRYRGEIAYTDHELGRLLAGLREGGRRGEPLVVVVADHGEAFGEHGEHQHGLFVYEPTIHVPWLLAWRGHVPAGGVVAGEVTIADVAPTVLGLLGLRPLPAAQGLDLSESIVRGVPAPQRSGILVENLLPRLEFGWSELIAVRRGSSKYIRAPREELYDLDADPSESRDLAVSQRDAAGAARSRLDAILRESERAASGETEGATVLDDEARANLQSLGYVGATAPRGAAHAGAQAAADPKDRLEEFLLTKEATRLVSLGEYAQARAKVEALLARDPGNVWMRQQLAQIHLATGDPPAAAAIYRGILAEDPRHCESLFRLGEIEMVSSRDLEAAAARFGEALACNPDDARSLGRLAAIERSRGKLEASRRHLDRAVELQPSDGTLLAQLAEAQAAAGEEAASRATWERVLDLDPRSTAALVGLATLDLRGRDLGAARERLERALAVDPDDPVANANLGAVLLRQGEADEGIRRLRAALARDGTLAPARLNLAIGLARRGELDAAREEAERFSALVPGEGAPWLELAKAYDRAGRPADAEEARRRASRR